MVVANTTGSTDAVRHLAAQGCRRVAAIGLRPDAGVVTADLRHHGYRQACQELSLPVEEGLQMRTPLWRRADGAAAVQRLLEQKVVFDGLYCFNDSLALGALHALVVAGVKVSDEVEVIGFDDTEEASYSSPALSSIRPGKTEIADQAARLLDRQRRGEFRGGVPHKVVARLSTQV